MSISAICVCEIYIYQQYMYMRDIYLLAVHVYERYISISGIYLLATHFNYIIIYLYIMSTRSDAPLPRHIQISMYAPYIFISGICLLITYIEKGPIADEVEQNLEIISKTFSTNQNSAHGIYDSKLVPSTKWY